MARMDVMALRRNLEQMQLPVRLPKPITPSGRPVYLVDSYSSDQSVVEFTREHYLQVVEICNMVTGKVVDIATPFDERVRLQLPNEEEDLAG